MCTAQRFGDALHSARRRRCAQTLGWWGGWSEGMRRLTESVHFLKRCFREVLERVSKPLLALCAVLLTVPAPLCPLPFTPQPPGT